MKQKSFFVGLTIATIVMLIFSIVAVGKVLSTNPKGYLAADLQPLAAQFLPRRSPLVASFLVNPDRLALAAKLATKPSDRRQLDREITEFKWQLKQTWKLDYKQDIQPWLGSEVTVAVTTTDLDRDPTDGLQAGYLIALSTDKPDLAQKYLDKFWQKQTKTGSDLTFEQYQGVSLVSTRADASSNQNFVKAIANARIGKFILFANDPSVIRNAINNLQAPNLALARNPDYQNSLQQLRLGFALTYVNPREIKDWAQPSANVDNSLPLNLMVGLKSSDLGIKAETILALNPTTSTLPAIANTGIDILNYVPVGSSLLVGNDLAQITNNISNPEQVNPFLGQAISQLKSILGFDLDFKSFDWITDRYAIAIPPTPNSKTASKSDSKIPQSSNWLLVAENNNPDRVKSALTQLDQNARDLSKFTVGEITIGDRSNTLWTKLNPLDLTKTVTGKIALVHTEIATATNKYVFIADSLATIESALKSVRTTEESQSSILAADPVFKAIADLIGTQNGLIYLNAEDLRNVLSLKSPLINLKQNLGLNLGLNRLQSLAIGDTKITSTPDTTFLNGQMLLNWQKPKS
jgi:hypothetical protein